MLEYLHALAPDFEFEEDEDDLMLCCHRCGLSTVVQIGDDRLCLERYQLET